MNKYLRAFGILSILCFSFYCTEQTALLMQKKDPIYETIEAVKEDYQVSFVDAVVEGDYIIPGVVGLQIDVQESFKNMKYVGAFHSNQLVFEEIKPTVSITDYKNKIINRGNPLKQGVAFIVKEERIIEYLEEMGISYAVLTTKDTVHKNRAYGLKINDDPTSYKEVEKMLSKQKEDSNFCFVKNGDTSFCESKEKILVEKTFEVSQTNFVQTYQQINSGSIIYFHDNLEIANLKLILEQIRFRGLEVLSLDELLSESR